MANRCSCPGSFRAHLYKHCKQPEKSDDWQFFNKEETEEAVANKINAFRTSVADYINTENGDVEHIWMSTDTVNADEDSMVCDWKDYFADKAWYDRLREAKAAVDPCNVFSHDMTIPLPSRYGKNGYGAGVSRKHNRICRKKDQITLDRRSKRKLCRWYDFWCKN